MNPAVQRIKQQPPSEQQQMRELVEMLQQAHRFACRINYLKVNQKQGTDSNE